jgi:hypothetical protein
MHFAVGGADSPGSSSRRTEVVDAQRDSRNRQRQPTGPIASAQPKPSRGRRGTQLGRPDASARVLMFDIERFHGGEGGGAGCALAVRLVGDGTAHRSGAPFHSADFGNT